MGILIAQHLETYNTVRTLKGKQILCYKLEDKE